MGQQISRADIRRILEFYRAMGLEEIFAFCPPKAGAETKNAEKTGKRKDPAAKEMTAAREKEKEKEKEKQKKLEALFSREMEGCTRCKLSLKRTNIVFGEGNPSARLMFIGEAPGAEEDKQGRPFVGRAGGLLTNLIIKLGLTREEVFIANMVKCRPEDNRDPEEDEVSACIPFLKKQISIISPEAIIALGRVAAQTLLGTQVQISKLRGRFASFEGIPLMPTFHPSYLLRNPRDKVLTWEDALQVLALLGLEVPGGPSS